MKTRIIYMLIGSLLYHTSHAEVSSSNEFFTAYQLSQVSGLANSINQYAVQPQTIEAIATNYLSTFNNPDLIKKYQQDNDFHQRLKQVITDYLNSKEASQLFDTLATTALADTYNYDELKALYQLYDTVDGQNFVKNQQPLVLSQATQSFQQWQSLQATLKQDTDKLLTSIEVAEKPNLDKPNELENLPHKVPIETIHEEETQQPDVKSSDNKE